MYTRESRSSPSRSINSGLIPDLIVDTIFAKLHQAQEEAKACQVRCRELESELKYYKEKEAQAEKDKRDKLHRHVESLF